MTTGEWSVYSLFDTAEDLLYIGASKDVVRRVRRHTKRQKWGNEIAKIQVNASALTMRDAYGEEAELIREYSPRYNITHKYVNEVPTVKEPLTSKERFDGWLAEFAMKQWYSILFFARDGDEPVEIPLFVQEGREREFFKWTSTDGDQVIEISPSLDGRATIYDKNVLIYLLSQLVNGERSGRPKSECRTFRLDVHNYLMCTKKWQDRDLMHSL